jgi:regulator of sigma E protease
MIITLAAFIVALGALVVVHEFGHFLAAKRLGVKVERFSVGFGPIIYSRQRGETEYALSAVPLGGYVKMLGEDDEEGAAVDPERAFSSQSLARRTLIVAAGPVMNLLFALVAHIVLAGGYGINVPSPEPIIGAVSAESPASVAGLEPGDRVVSIDRTPVPSWEAMAELVRGSGGRELAFTIDRDGEQLAIAVVPALTAMQSLFGEETEHYLIGVGVMHDHRDVGPLEAVTAGFERTRMGTWLVTKGFVLMLAGRVPLQELGGPIAIAQAAGEQARLGTEAFLAMLAFLSINLGVLNLLPIPVLDGGHLALFGVEAIIRRPIRPRVRDAAQSVGLLLLVSLMILVLFNDVSRLVQG